MVTKNGDMTISSWRRQLLVSFESFKLTFEVTGNGGVQEETVVLHGRWTYFEANSRDGGEESFQDEACDSTTTTTTTVAWQAKKINKINK